MLKLSRKLGGNLKTKWFYGFLFIDIIIWLTAFTFVNIVYFGSVMQVNVPILVLMLILPLYDGYRRKVYLKRVASLMYIIFTIVVLIVVTAMPKYSYNEAIEIVEKQEGIIVEDVMKKYTNDSDVFYNGKYYLPYENGAFVFNFKTGTYEQGVKNEN